MNTSRPVIPALVAVLASALTLGACSRPAAVPGSGEEYRTPMATSTTARPDSALLARARNIPPPESSPRPARVEQLERSRVDEYQWLKDERWQEVMRDTSLLRADIRAHLETENAYYQAVMTPTEALQETLYREMRGRIKEDDASVPSRDGDWFYYVRHREGGQYPVFARRPAGEDGAISGEEQIVFDGDAEADGFDYFGIGAVEHSPDHRYLAYAIDMSGSEFYEIRVRDLHSGEDMATITDEGYGSLVWANDARTLYWVWRDPNNRPRRVYRQAFDAGDGELIYEEADAGYFLALGKTEGDTWIVLHAGSHTTTEQRLFAADDAAAAPLLVSEREEGVEYSLTEAGDRIYVRTNQDGAVDFKVMVAPLDDPRRENWQEFADHRPGTLVTGLEGFSRWLVRAERSEALPRFIVRDLESGKEHAIRFEEEAYALGVVRGHEFAIDTLRFSYSSPSTPAQTWDYDMAGRGRTLLKTQEVPSGHDPEDYMVRRLMAKARDGARVPVTVLYHRDTPVDGSAPLLLYGYGSYGFSMPAGFSTNRLSLVDRGMVYAIAHVRGGMDMGYQWYLDGKLDKKPNTFNDFIDAARALIEAGYTSAGRLVAHGRSAGGLLVGASINQAPELFAGAIADVPFVDVLNTMSDESLPLTPPEWPEWGNPLTDPDAYDLILSYSPYDQVAERDYPHVLATGGLADPRVTYWEPAKWIARLRDRRTGDGVSLLRTNMGAGHGGASGRFDSLLETAQEQAFALMVTGLGEPGPTRQ